MSKNGKINFHNFPQQQPNYIPNNKINNQTNYINNNGPEIKDINNNLQNNDYNNIKH